MLVWALNWMALHFLIVTFQIHCGGVWRQNGNTLCHCPNNYRPLHILYNWYPLTGLFNRYTCAIWYNPTQQSLHLWSWCIFSFFFDAVRNVIILMYKGALYWIMTLILYNVILCSPAHHHHLVQPSKKCLKMFKLQNTEFIALLLRWIESDSSGVPHEQAGENLSHFIVCVVS